MTRGVEGDFGCGWRGVGGLLGVSGEEARHSDVPLPLLCNEIEKQYHMINSWNVTQSWGHSRIRKPKRTTAILHACFHPGVWLHCARSDARFRRHFGKDQNVFM